MSEVKSKLFVLRINLVILLETIKFHMSIHSNFAKIPVAYISSILIWHNNLYATYCQLVCRPNNQTKFKFQSFV